MPIAYDEKQIVRPGREIQFTPDMVRELAKCATDILYFAEKYVTIIHPMKGEMLITLYPYQKEMIKTMSENRFSIFCCGRQLGKSTCACIYLLWYTLFNPSKTVAILANKQSTAVSLIGDIKKAYAMLPAWLKPGVIKYDQLEIGFENDSRMFARATSSDALRGESISLMFLDEFSYVPQEVSEDFWISNFPTISCLPASTFILTDSGYQQLGNYIPKDSKVGGYYEIENLKVWGKEGLEKVSHFYVSPHSKTNIISTTHGLEHESTLEHPVYVVNENGIGMVRSKNIKIGDSVRVDIGMNVYGNSSALSYRVGSAYNNIPIYNTKIKKIDTDMAYMIGGYLGQGWSDQESIYLSNRNDSFKNVFISNKKLHFRPVKNSKLNIFSDKRTSRVFKYLLGDVYDKKCHEKYIPNIVFGLPKELQMNVIAGYIDAVGEVTKKGDVIIGSTSKKMLQQTQLILLNMGIVSKVLDDPIGKYALHQNRGMTAPNRTTWPVRPANQVNSWKSVCYGNGLFVAISSNGANQVRTSSNGITWTAKSLLNSYKLTIPRCYAKDILKFGMRVIRKRDRLKVNVDHSDKNTQECIKIYPWMRDEIIKSMSSCGVTDAKLRLHGCSVAKIKSNKSKILPLDTLRKFLELVPSEKLQNLVANKCIYVEVNGITPGYSLTYDLTCPSSHTFLQNGILGSNTGGSVIVVSTPNGTAGKFYQLWTQATTDKSSKWKAMRVKWDAHPDRDEAWKEGQLQSLGKQKFAQEHSTSFTGSSYTLIDGDKIASIKPLDPVFYPEDGYIMWQKPVPRKIYMVTCDVAKGSNNDYHVANVWDVTSWHISGKIEQVAMYRRNDVSIFDFKDKIKQISQQYNKAMAVIENNNLGSVVVQNLYFEDGYENVWFDVDKGDYGINANVKTKPLALSYFKEDVESGKMIIRSAEMLTELSYFEEIRTGIFQARPGRGFFDDTVVSGYWTSYALRSRFWEDHLQFILQNSDLNVAVNSGEVQNDEENMREFIKAFGQGNYTAQDDLDGFRNDLSRE